MPGPTMPKIPSPCVDVCKHKRDGHCIACSMTKGQKKLSKRLKNDAQRATFIEQLRQQQADLGGFEAWEKLYARKCQRKGATPPKAA